MNEVTSLRFNLFIYQRYRMNNEYMYLQMKNSIVFTKSTQVLKQACSNGIWETIETFPGG